MLTMALAGRLVTGWAADPAAVRTYGVRFTRPVVVPDDDKGALLELSGKVTEVSEAADGARVARVAITASLRRPHRARPGHRRGRATRRECAPF